VAETLAAIVSLGVVASRDVARAMASMMNEILTENPVIATLYSKTRCSYLGRRKKKQRTDKKIIVRKTMSPRVEAVGNNTQISICPTEIRLLNLGGERTRLR
jgi:hypothetical protein